MHCCRFWLTLSMDFKAGVDLLLPALSSCLCAMVIRVSSESNCKVLKWGLFRLPAYVVNVTKVFAVFSGCNTRLFAGFLLPVCW